MSAVSARQAASYLDRYREALAGFERRAGAAEEREAGAARDLDHCIKSIAQGA